MQVDADGLDVIMTPSFNNGIRPQVYLTMSRFSVKLSVLLKSPSHSRSERGSWLDILYFNI